MDLPDESRGVAPMLWPTGADEREIDSATSIPPCDCPLRENSKSVDVPVHMCPHAMASAAELLLIETVHIDRSEANLHEGSSSTLCSCRITTFQQFLAQERPYADLLLDIAAGFSDLIGSLD